MTKTVEAHKLELKNKQDHNKVEILVRVTLSVIVLDGKARMSDYPGVG